MQRGIVSGVVRVVVGMAVVACSVAPAVAATERLGGDKLQS